MARSFTSTTHNITSANGVAPPSQGTVSIWIRPNWSSDSSVHRFWCFATSGSTADLPSFQKFSDGKIYAGFNESVYGDQRIIISAAGLFTSGQWANWIFTYSSGGCALYKNGSSVGTKGAITIPSLNSGYVIGNFMSGATANANAGVAEFALWDSVLSAAEIAAIAKGMTPLLCRPSSLKIYNPVLGLGSGEPDWGPSRYANTVSGTAYQNHAPVSFWMPPATLMPVYTFAGSLALTQGASRTAIAMLEKFSAAAAALQPSNQASLFGITEQPIRIGNVAISDAMQGGLLAANDQAKSGLALADAGLYRVQISDHL